MDETKKSDEVKFQDEKSGGRADQQQELFILVHCFAVLWWDFDQAGDHDRGVCRLWYIRSGGGWVGPR